MLRLGYFTSQPAALLTAVCDDNARVDLLIVPPDTDAGLAEAAMSLAATTGNLVHAQYLLITVAAASTRETGGVPEQSWETDGGRLRTRGSTARVRAPRPTGPAAATAA